jgi:HEAT repeat protein
MPVPDDPATEQAGDTGSDSAAGRRAVAAAGHRGDADTARRGLGDARPGVRATALGALARCGALRLGDIVAGLDDPSPVVRRRAATEAVALTGRGSRSVLWDALRSALADADPLVAESAAWALGECRARPAVADLVAVAGSHADTRCREAAVAALGSIGDRAGLAGVLGALGDRPTVRRRAAVALAAFEGPEVEAALRRCLEDRDWQVRQAAEILLGA